MTLMPETERNALITGSGQNILDLRRVLMHRKLLRRGYIEEAERFA